MTQRHQLDARLALYGELSGILSAMRSFALTELRRVTQREAAQQQADAALSQAMADMMAALPLPESCSGDIWIVLGSVRGFCASFNEDVLRLWQQEAGAILSTIVVGERLAALMPESAGTVAVPGAIGTADGVNTIDRILAAVEAARRTAGRHVGLIICFRDEEGARTRRLLPLSVSPGRDAGDLPAVNLPATNEPAAKVAAGVAQHYVFHMLLSVLLRSLRIENHMRLMQMENALQHIERSRDDLLRLRNQLRQEEIVEEIELILHRESPP